MEEHPPPVLLNPLWIAACHEINGNRINPMNLLVGIARAIANRNYKDQQIGVLFRDLGEDLDEIKGPILPRELLRICKAVKPGLEFVKQQHRWCVPQHL